MSRCVWALVGEEILEAMERIRAPNAKQWLFCLQEAMSATDFNHLVVTLWAIWTARRTAIHDNVFESPFATHGFVKRFLGEIEILSKIEHQSSNSGRRASPQAQGLISHAISRTSASRWKVPPSGFTKIKVVGGHNTDGTIGVASTVCRDSNGAFLGSSVLVVPGVHVTTVLETLVVREGQALTEDLGFQEIVVSSDSKMVVEDIKNAHGRLHKAIIQ